jgi:hypothetical protein
VGVHHVQPVPSFLLKYESRYKAEIEKIVFDQAD